VYTGFLDVGKLDDGVGDGFAGLEVLEVEDHVLGLEDGDAAPEVVVVADPADQASHIEPPLFWRHLQPALDVNVVNAQTRLRGEELADLADVTLLIGHHLPVREREPVLLERRLRWGYELLHDQPEIAATTRLPAG
jgi:hypothetical protein